MAPLLGIPQWYAINDCIMKQTPWSAFYVGRSRPSFVAACQRFGFPTPFKQWQLLLQIEFRPWNLRGEGVEMRERRGGGWGGGVKSGAHGAFSQHTSNRIVFFISNYVIIN